MQTPCLANGGLSVTADGEKNVDDSPLLHPIRGGILPGGSVAVSAANLPVECCSSAATISGPATTPT
ncbi:unnamed protein product [Ectocarpus sp. 12 AP-2014]